MAAAAVTYTRGEVPTLVRKILSADPETDSMAGTQSHCGSDPGSVVEQASSTARFISTQAHEECERTSSRSHQMGADTR